MDFDGILEKINQVGEAKRVQMTEDRKKKQNEYAETLNKVKDLAPEIEGYIKIYKSLKGNNLIDNKFLENRSGLNNSIVIKGGSSQDSVGYYTKGKQSIMPYIGVCLNDLVDDGHDVVMKPYYFCMDSYGTEHYYEYQNHPSGMVEVDSSLPKSIYQIDLRIRMMKRFLKGFEKFKRNMKKALKEIGITVD